jgi:uncharacterized protein DUF4350
MSPSGRTGRRRLAGLVLAGLVVVTGVLSVWLGRPDSSEEGPEGTLALMRFLPRMGVAVSSAETPPRTGTFVLLRDLRTPREARSLLSWVSKGGRLVVAEPESGVLEAMGEASAPVEEGAIGSHRHEVLQPGCIAPEVVGVRRLVVAPSDAGFSTPAAALGCFPGASGAFLVVAARGSGSVVALGGRSPLTNELLREGDNALLALRLFAASGPVVFGPPAPAAFGQGKGLWASLPARAKAAAAGLVLALVLFAIARGRRLGKPVLEEPLTTIPSSQLVQAAAGLYRNARAAGHAGALLRRAAAWRLAHRLGLPDADPSEVRRALAADGRLDADAAVLDGPGPAGDDELIALGQDLAELEAAAVRELR